MLLPAKLPAPSVLTSICEQWQIRLEQRAGMMHFYVEKASLVTDSDPRLHWLVLVHQ